jgi:hypothetical protein
MPDHERDGRPCDKAAHLWGKAGQRSLARSALIEAAEQLTRASDPVCCSGSAPETQAAVERARLLIEQAEALGEIAVNSYVVRSPETIEDQEQQQWIVGCFSASARK